jgi:hypothetical protein
VSEEALQRILDREGLYWAYPGDDTDDARQPRWVELRIDAQADRVREARKELESEGWTLASQPDDADDPIQRLYFRKMLPLTEEEREAMLIAGYKAAVASNGTFWSWISLDEEKSS